MSSNPVVLITGASRGLGRGIALSCAALGCDIAIHYQGNEAAARETEQLCRQVGAQAHQKFSLVQGNVASTEDRARFFAEVLRTFGRLDALVNNAGMAPRVRADVTETTEESYDEVMAVNLKGPYFLSQLAARHWLQHPNQSVLPGGYKLIFITSISADTASVNRGEYCMSKAGLAMACQLWAMRLPDAGVQAFEIRPGVMETDMTKAVKEKYDRLLATGIVPQNRWGKPEDVGLAVGAIMKGSFPFSTGEVLYVDGGFHMRRL
jgi:NAD(P)-dependent dehydrogenase (short-subunit alcohol dehydrogenase family)